MLGAQPLFDLIARGSTSRLFCSGHAGFHSHRGNELASGTGFVALYSCVLLLPAGIQEHQRQSNRLWLDIHARTSATAGLAQDAKPTRLGSLPVPERLVSGQKGDSEIPKDRLDGIVRIMPGTMTLYDKDNNEIDVMRYSIEDGKCRPGS